MMLPKPNLGYTTYVAIESLPMLIFPSIYIVACIVAICVEKRLHKSGFRNYLLDFMFGPQLSVVTFAPTTERGTTLYVDTTEVSKYVSWSLYLIGILFLPSAFIVFWDVFVFTESHLCDDITIDCFSSLNLEAVKNCTNYKDLDVEFICFEFTFLLGQGVAVVGGVLTGLQYMVRIISRVLIWQYKLIKDDKKSGRRNCCGCRNCCCLFISPPAIIVSIVSLCILPYYLPYGKYKNYPFSKFIAIYFKN